jgi:amidase
VDDSVRAAVKSLGELGASVKEVSVPIHRDGIHIWNAIATEGQANGRQQTFLE